MTLLINKHIRSQARQGRNASGSSWAKAAFPPLNACHPLSIPGWLRGEHSLLLLPEPQQMTTFRSVISLGSTAGQAIHFSTIKGQRSLCRAVVPSALQRESRRQPWREHTSHLGLAAGQPWSESREWDACHLMGSVRPGQAWVSSAARAGPVGHTDVWFRPCLEELHWACLGSSVTLALGSQICACRCWIREVYLGDLHCAGAGKRLSVRFM